MPARWLVGVAWCSLAIAFASSSLIVFDVYGRGRRQWMAVMEAVWPLTALYFGPLGFWAYRRLGRGVAGRRHDQAALSRARLSGVAVSVTHLVISRMRRLSVRAGLAAAARSDVIALSAFEIGLFGWMAVMRFVLFPGSPLSPSSPVYWLFMQIGMVLGFATSWPANAWLIRRGIKDVM
jgi:hypothetical protein